MCIYQVYNFKKILIGDSGDSGERKSKYLTCYILLGCELNTLKNLEISIEYHHLNTS